MGGGRLAATTHLLDKEGRVGVGSCEGYDMVLSVQINTIIIN